MENNHKILTIAIPTYNRCEKLRKCLDHICPQITDDVQVVVRDNHSTKYDFKSFIKFYEGEYKVKAIQNMVNIGADANIARLFEKCETKWLWILGDDDLVLPNAVSTALTIVRNNPDDIFIKFNALSVGRFYGIKGFGEAMKPRGAFSSSFFLSEGIHNISKSTNDLYWQYRYLSTSISQILRVMWHLVNNEKDSCLFVDDKLLVEHGQEITWSHVDIVPYQALIYDIFKPYRKYLKNNVFKDIVRYCYVYISESSLSFRNRWYLYGLFIYKQGLFTILRYNYFDLAIIMGRSIFPKKWRYFLKKYFLN